MPATLLLDQDAWDLVMDSSGNIAMASEPYSIPQDVASACRTFLGECWYDTSQGIPYWQQILGHLPPSQYVREQLAQTALTVPNVSDAKAVLVIPTERGVGGQLQIVDVNGNAAGVTLK